MLAVNSPYTSIIFWFGLVCHSNLWSAGAGTVAGAGRVHRHVLHGGERELREARVFRDLGLATGNQQNNKEKVSQHPEQRKVIF